MGEGEGGSREEDPRLGWFEKKINAGAGAHACAYATCLAGTGCGVLTQSSDAGIRVKPDKLDKFMKGDPMSVCPFPPALSFERVLSYSVCAVAAQTPGGMERSCCTCPS